MFGNMTIKMRMMATMSVLTGLLLVLGSFGLYVGNHSVSVLESSVLHDKSAENSVERIKLRMEMAHAQLLGALEHNPDLAIAKLHDHPVSKHLDAIATQISMQDGYLADYLKNQSSDPEERRLFEAWVFLGCFLVGSSRVDLQACKLEYSIVSPK